MWPPSSTARSELAAQRPPLVAGLVDLVLERQRLELRAEPLPGRIPRRRPGDALRAVLVAGQLAELAQLGDGAGRVERHGGDSNSRRECGKE